MKPAAALPVPEIGQALGAAFRPPYRGGRWFESTAAHHCFIHWDSLRITEAVVNSAGCSAPLLEIRGRLGAANELLIRERPKLEIEVVHPPIVAATSGPLGDAASGDKHVYHADHIDCRDLLERAPCVEPDCVWRCPEAIEPGAVAVDRAQLGRCRAAAGIEPAGLTWGLDQP